MGSEKKEYQRNKYIIRIQNNLDSHWEHWFEGMIITHTEEGCTILTGEMVDQSALVGLVEKIHNLNLSLISVQKVDSG